MKAHLLIFIHLPKFVVRCLSPFADNRSQVLPPMNRQSCSKHLLTDYSREGEGKGKTKRRKKWKRGRNMKSKRRGTFVRSFVCLLTLRTRNNASTRFWLKIVGTEKLVFFPFLSLSFCWRVLHALTLEKKYIEQSLNSSPLLSIGM